MVPRILRSMFHAEFVADEVRGASLMSNYSSNHVIAEKRRLLLVQMSDLIPAIARDLGAQAHTRSCLTLDHHKGVYRRNTLQHRH